MKGGKHMRSSGTLFVFLGLLVMQTISCSDVLGRDANDSRFGYSDYAAVLKNHIDDTGMVSYKKLRANPKKLQAFVSAMSKLDRWSYDKWSKEEKIAFWVNAYNALTLKVIIDNYPIKSSFFRSRVYPKNSIRQIPGVWDKITFKVMETSYTLGHMERKILRKEFNEPRIHMALVCAAMGCPPLLNEPYVAERLDQQFEEQSKKFLSNPGKFRIDREKAVVYLSPILKWFADDFVNSRAPQKNIAKHNKKTSAVLNFIGGYLKEAEREYVLGGSFKIKYLNYDWSLNEQQIKDKKSKEPKK
jgi:hypothetical protein